MKSTISLNKINAVIKKNFRLNAASLIITNAFAMIGTLLICGVIIGMPPKKRVDEYICDITPEFMNTAYVLISVLGIVSLLFLSLKMFREIYSRRASDAFYSMPVTRGEYYAGNALFGMLHIAFLLISIIAVAVIFGKLPFFDTAYNVLHIRPFIAHMLMAAAGLVFAFALFMISAVLCGRRWQAVAASVLVFFSVTAFMGGICSHMNSVYGYYTMASGDAFGVLLALFNGGESVSLAVQSIFKLAVAVMLLAVGYFVFKNRKAEVAEQSLSGRIVPALLLASVLFGMFMAFADYSGRLYIEIAIGAAACVVSSVIFCAVFYKKVFTKDAAIVCAVVCAASAAFVIGADKLPQATGYTDYIPAAEEVAYAEFEESSDNYAYSNSFYNFMDNLMYSENFYYDSETEDKFKLTQQDSIDCVLKLHAKAVDDVVMDKFAAYHDPEQDFDVDDNWYSFRLTYHLKNGKRIIRSYAVFSKDIMAEYADFLRTDEVIEQSFPFSLDKDTILFARVEEPYEETVTADTYDASSEYEDMDYSVAYSADSYFTLENYDEFFSLLKQDVKARDDYGAVMQSSTMFYIMNDKYMKNEQYIYIYYFDKDTPDALKEKFRKMTPVQAENYVYNDNEDFYLKSDQIIINTAKDKNAAAYLTERGILK